MPSTKNAMTTDPREALAYRYDTFIHQEKPWAFFIGLSDYIDYVLSTPQFSSVLKSELGKRNTIYKVVEIYEKLAWSEMQESKNKLFGMIKKNKINVDDFSRDQSSIPSMKGEGSPNILEHLQMFEDGRISMGHFPSDTMNHFLFDIAANLRRLGCKEVEEFAVSDDEYEDYYWKVNSPNSDTVFHQRSNSRGNFIFSKSWPLRFEQTAKLEAQRKIESWGSFVQLIEIWHAKRGFSKNISLHKAAEESMHDKEYPLQSDEASDVIFLMEDIRRMSGNENAVSLLHHFRIFDLKPMVTRVNTMLLQKASTETHGREVTSGAKTKALQKIITEAEQGILIDRIDALEKRLADESRVQTGNSAVKVDSGHVGENPAYLVSFSDKRENRAFILNNEYVFSNPRYMGENHKFSEYVFSHQNKDLSRKNMEDELGIKFQKTFHQIINDLGFTGELRRIFFPSVSKDGVLFRDSVSKEELERMEIDQKKLMKDIQGLKKIKTGKNKKQQETKRSSLN